MEKVSFGEYKGMPMSIATLTKDPEYWRNILDNCDELDISDELEDWLREGYRDGYI